MIGDCLIVISSDDPPKVLKSGDDKILMQCCPVCVHIEACWTSSFGSPPESGCFVLATGSLDIPLFIPGGCPIDFTTSGTKIEAFTGNIDSSSSGPDCPNVANANVTSFIGLYWDSVAMEWTMEGRIVFPGWPASFLYGPVTVPVENLTTAGVITIVNEGCPSLDSNPAALITYQFSSVPCGACCDAENNCVVTTEGDCDGTWHEGESCESNPCGGIGVGACAVCDTCNSECTCFDGLTLEECNALQPVHGGTGWLEGGDCITNDCDYFGCTYDLTAGACCAGGFCLDDIDEETCTGFGGTFWQGGISCTNAIACGYTDCGT